MVEIEVDVFQPIVLDPIDGTFVRFLDGFLVPFLVHEVDQDLRTVQGDLLIKVSRQGFDL